jgi:hypothetical protein
MSRLPRKRVQLRQEGVAQGPFDAVSIIQVMARFGPDGKKQYWHEVALLRGDEVVYCSTIGYNGVRRFATEKEVDDEIKRLRDFLRTKADTAPAPSAAGAESEAAAPAVDAAGPAEAESDSTTYSDATSITAGESEDTTDRDFDW